MRSIEDVLAEIDQLILRDEGELSDSRRHYDESSKAYLRGAIDVLRELMEFALDL